jgi:hypothetical protein
VGEGSERARHLDEKRKREEGAYKETLEYLPRVENLFSEKQQQKSEKQVKL